MRVNSHLRLPDDPAPTSNPTPEPLAVSAKNLAILLGLGLRTIRTMDASGKLPRPIRLGGRLVWSVEEIRAWLAAGAPDRRAWESRKRPSKSS